MTANTPKRLLALDILRGITIAGMILVNNPGSWIRNARKFKNYPSTLFENPKSLEESSVLTGTELFSAHTV